MNNCRERGCISANRGCNLRSLFINIQIIIAWKKKDGKCVIELRKGSGKSKIVLCNELSHM